MFPRTSYHHLNLLLLAFLLCVLSLYSNCPIDQVTQQVNAQGQADGRESLKRKGSFYDALAKRGIPWPFRNPPRSLTFSDADISGSRADHVNTNKFEVRNEDGDGLPEVGSCDHDVSWHGSNAGDNDAIAPSRRTLTKRELTWSDARRKGADLICLMDMSKEDAEAKLNSQNSAWHASSPYNTISDLRRWGYKGKYLCDEQPLDDIDDMLSAKGIEGAPNSAKDNVQIRWFHEESYAATGSTNKDQPVSTKDYFAKWP